MAGYDNVRRPRMSVHPVRTRMACLRKAHLKMTQLSPVLTVELGAQLARIALNGIAQALPPDDRRRSILIEAAERHAHVGLIGIGSGDYMGEHWLGSFALYMLGCVPHQEAG
jgi:DUF2891 family protein